MVVAPRYETAEDFSDGLALVNDGGRQIFIDATGAVVIAPQFKFARPFANGLAYVARSSKAQMTARALAVNLRRSGRRDDTVATLAIASAAH